MESVRGTSYFLQVILRKQLGIHENRSWYPLDPRRGQWIAWQTQLELLYGSLLSLLVYLFLSPCHASPGSELLCLCSGPSLQLPFTTIPSHPGCRSFTVTHLRLHLVALISSLLSYFFPSQTNPEPCALSLCYFVRSVLAAKSLSLFAHQPPLSWSWMSPVSRPHHFYTCATTCCFQ